MPVATSDDVLAVLRAIKALDTKVTETIEDFKSFRAETNKQMGEIRRVVGILESDVGWSRDQIRIHDQETTVLASRLDALEDESTGEDAA